MTDDYPDPPEPAHVDTLFLRSIRDELSSIKQAIWLVCSLLVTMLVVLVLHFQYPEWKGWLFQ